jgi:hypothetical protein
MSKCQSDEEPKTLTLSLDAVNWASELGIRNSCPEFQRLDALGIGPWNLDQFQGHATPS